MVIKGKALSLEAQIDFRHHQLKQLQLLHYD